MLSAGSLWQGAELERLTAQAPEKPKDFRRQAAIACKCPDCKQVNEFLSDPNEAVKRMPLAKDRRQHLHQKIDHHRADLTHVTARSGRPFVLVISKTTASYDAACQIYERDKTNLQRLRRIESSNKPNTSY